MFRFRLARVLRHRQRLVDACTREVAAAERSCLRAETITAAAVRELEQCRRRAAAEREGRLDPAALARHGAWHELLGRRLHAAEQAAAAARAALAAAHDRLHAAWRDREVLVQLEERQRRDWALAEARRERRVLDEIGAIRAARDGAGRTRFAAGDPGGPRSAESVVT